MEIRRRNLTLPNEKEYIATNLSRAEIPPNKLSEIRPPIIMVIPDEANIHEAALSSTIFNLIEA